jgi:hypothetical protein
MHSQSRSRFRTPGLLNITLYQQQQEMTLRQKEYKSQYVRRDESTSEHKSKRAQESPRDPEKEESEQYYDKE